MSRKLSLISTIAALLTAFVTVADGKQQEPLLLETFKTFSRISFLANTNIPRKLETSRSGFRLTFVGANMTDLGVIFGTESEWVKEIDQIEDPRIGTINVREEAGNLIFEAAWKFDKSDQAPANQVMEFFEYDKRNPNRYIIDFWQKPGPTVAQVKKTKKLENRKRELKQANNNAKARKERRETEQLILNEKTMPDQFCSEPLNDKSTIVIPFRPIHQKIDLSRWIVLNTPDAEYPYRKPIGNQKDAEYVRKALKMYESGKTALTVRIIEFFEEEFKKSPFSLEMKFLKANALLKLGYEKRAMESLRIITEKNPTHPIALHSTLFLGLKSFEAKEYLKSAELFQKLANTHPNHRLIWLLQYVSAESYYYLKQTNRAAKAYLLAAQTVDSESTSANIMFRVGDLYLERKQYAQALAEYYRAIKQYPNEVKTYPTVLFNRAEALYWLGQYDRARKDFQEFTEKFTEQSDIWRAYYRLSEIQARKKSMNDPGVKRQLLAALNSSPYSTGEVISRARLLECFKDDALNEIAINKFFMTNIQKTEWEDLFSKQQMRDYLRIAFVRSFASQSDFQMVVELGIQVLEAPIGGSAGKLLNESIRKSFRLALLSLLEADRPFDALTFYDKYASQIPGGVPISTDYLMALSRAAARIGLGSFSAEIIAELDEKKSGFQRYLVDGRTVATAPDGSLDQRIRESESQFTKALALWAKSGLTSENEIMSHLEEVDDVTRFSVPKQILVAQIYEKKKDFENAIASVSKAVLLNLDKNIVDPGRLKYWAARIHLQQGNFDLFVSTMREILSDRDSEKEKKSTYDDDLMASLTLLEVPTEFVLAKQLIRELEKQKRWDDAVEELTGLFERGYEAQDEKYFYAMALRRTEKSENIEKSQEILENLVREKKDAFWAGRAQDALDFKTN